jgi:hypothetical protein
MERERGSLPASRNLFETQGIRRRLDVSERSVRGGAFGARPPARYRAKTHSS